MEAPRRTIVVYDSGKGVRRSRRIGQIRRFVVYSQGVRLIFQVGKVPESDRLGFGVTG